MFLNDKEIRARSLVPTHQSYYHNSQTRHLYAKVGEDWYSVDTGHHYAEEFMIEHGGPDRELTPQERMGYALGGSMVPVADGYAPPDQERGQPMTWGRMITPYEPGQVRVRKNPTKPLLETGINEVTRPLEEKIISYGTSSFGYDLRLGHKFRVFTNLSASVVDPKNFDNKSFVDVTVPDIGGEIIIPPNSFILGYSLEYMRIPDDILGIVVGKSTIARMGINCLCTPLEPGWEGHVTLEFSNSTPLPARLYVGEGCCQVLFGQGNRPEVTYGDRGGKYQGQGNEAVLPKV
jgi:dCTP deaminase